MNQNLFPDIPDLPLFYHQPVLLRFQEHKCKVFRSPEGCAFAASANAVPLNITEFMPALRHYPIVFSDAVNPIPLALLGLRQDQNIFVQPDGLWRPDTYIPAYVRRYPFIAIEIPGQDKMLLGIDAASTAFVETDIDTGEGAQLFFDEKGAPTAFSQGAIAFCEAYYHDHLQTRAFISALVEQNLLIKRLANVQFTDTDHYRLEGFLTIEAERLGTLSSDVLSDWESKGWLAAVHLHIASMQNWQILLDLNSKISKEGTCG